MLNRRNLIIGGLLLLLFAVVISRRMKCEGCERRRAKLADWLGVEDAAS